MGADGECKAYNSMRCCTLTFEAPRVSCVFPAGDFARKVWRGQHGPTKRTPIRLPTKELGTSTFHTGENRYTDFEANKTVNYPRNIGAIDKSRSMRQPNVRR